MSGNGVQAPRYKFKTLQFSNVRFLTSNDQPSDSDLEKLARLLHDIETELEELAARQSTTGIVDDELKPECESLESLRRAVKSAMSAIRRLPCEILEEIFFLALLADTGAEWNNLDIKTTPWTLTRVSKRWYEIALRDRRLWSSISIGRYCKSASANLTTCLARSGQHPLTISIFVIMPMVSLLKQLSLCSERWKYLAITHVDSTTHFFGLLKSVKGRLPELSELHIKLWKGVLYDPPSTTCPSFDMFLVAPKLRKVTLDFNTGTLKDRSAQFLLPWNQLTSLSTETFQLLYLCPQLLECSLRKCDIRGKYPKIYRPITLPNLHTLTLDDPKLSTCLVLPSLETLRVNKRISRAQIDFLASSFRRTLKRLEIRVTATEFIMAVIEGTSDISTAQALLSRKEDLPSYLQCSEFEDGKFVIHRRLGDGNA